MELVRKEVEFHNSKLVGIQKDGKIYTQVKQISEILGVQAHNQIRRIKNDETLSKGIIKIPLIIDNKKQDTYILDIDFLPFWLTGIKSNQCKEEIREKLLDFKINIRTVLAEAFLERQIISELTSLMLEINEKEEDRDVCVNRLVGYMKDVCTLEEQIRKLSKELKIKLSFIKVDTDIYYDSLG